jgi:hypothetical protein
MLRGSDDPDSWYAVDFAPRQSDAKGILTSNKAKAAPGYTLYASTLTTSASLVDLDGNVVWSWELPFHDAWPNPVHLRKTAKEENIFWRKAVMYPNGDLLVIYDGVGVTPGGHGLARIDKDSRLLWKFSDAAHHDVQVDDAGNIYTLTYGFRTERVEGYKVMEPPMLVDDVVILDPQGNEKKRINVVDAINNSSWRLAFYLVTPNAKGDYFHTNSVHPISAEAARALDFAEAGDILISLRELSAIMIIDPETSLVKWVMRGPWVGQHDAEALANGNMLIFDNKGALSGEHGFSRIVEFNPVTNEIVWQYAGSPEAGLASRIRGAQQRLPNGNTLITQSARARLVEVTPDHEIVWDYRNPVRRSDEDNLAPVLMWGQRYSPDYVEFLGASTEN